MADLRLRRNDVVFVPAQQEVFVSVLGDVGHPGAIPLTPESTLTSDLGPVRRSGRRRFEQHSSDSAFDWKDNDNLVQESAHPPGADEVQLHAGDVVFVPYGGLAKFTYVFQRISPVASMGILSALIP